MAKLIKIADLREMDQLITKGEISWGKAAEILSERAEERHKSAERVRTINNFYTNYENSFILGGDTKNGEGFIDFVFNNSPKKVIRLTAKEVDDNAKWAVSQWSGDMMWTIDGLIESKLKEVS